MQRGGNYLVINKHDNLDVAFEELQKGAGLPVAGANGAEEATLTLADNNGFGHRFALTDLEPGNAIISVGGGIGEATTVFARYNWVYTYNVRGQGGCRAEGVQCCSLLSKSA